jgi:hypothetical protein
LLGKCTVSGEDGAGFCGEKRGEVRGKDGGIVVNCMVASGGLKIGHQNRFILRFFSPFVKKERPRRLSCRLHSPSRTATLKAGI